MKISPQEQAAIRQVIEHGRRFGFGNLIGHLNTAWARALVEEGMDEKSARASTHGDGFPFAMQDDLIECGEWDHTGLRYK